MGTDGTCQLEFELPDNVVFKEQELSYEKTFENLDTKLDWCFLRIPENKNYRFSDNALELCGTKITLDETASPTFAAIRQTEFDITLCCDVECGQQECGISFYMDELHHYEIGARLMGQERTTVFVRQTIAKDKDYPYLQVLTFAKVLGLLFAFFSCLFLRPSLGLTSHFVTRSNVERDYILGRQHRSPHH